jgi:transposase InsO family protein
VLPIETWTRFKLIHEPEWTGMTVSDVCRKYGVSRETFYKWRDRYIKHGMEGLKDLSRKPHNITSKVTEEFEEAILDLRLNKRFGANRIRFRLKRLEISLSSRTIYKILKRHGLNVLKCRIKKRKCRRFAMKHPNDMVQIDILGPFYMRESCIRNYMINCIDDCSRKVVSIWSNRKRSKDVLNVLEEWIRTNGIPKKVMHDNGKQFKSKIFKRFLEKNRIKDIAIRNGHPQTQGKIEAYNKIVKNEFLAVEDLASIDDGKIRYAMFVKAYNDEREHGGINGLTPSEMFIQALNRTDRKQNQARKCQPCR